MLLRQDMTRQFYYMFYTGYRNIRPAIKNNYYYSWLPVHVHVPEVYLNQYFERLLKMQNSQ